MLVLLNLVSRFQLSCEMPAERRSGLREGVEFAYEWLLDNGKARHTASALVASSRAAQEAWKKAATVVSSPPLLTLLLQTIFHWGFIPAIIAMGMCTEPRPSLLQLIGPL